MNNLVRGSGIPSHESMSWKLKGCKNLHEPFNFHRPSASEQEHEHRFAVDVLAHYSSPKTIVGAIAPCLNSSIPISPDNSIFII
jgi:hypothetical protein